MKGEGLKGATVDEGCGRVMEDRAKWMEGESGICCSKVYT
jgi:hypothetical protein